MAFTPTVGPDYPSHQNTFIPNHEATNQMVIDYARNINDFEVNQYTQIIPVTDMIGKYLEMTIEEAGRVLHTDGRNRYWEDGGVAPEFRDGTESLVWRQYECKRYAYGASLGNLTVDQATWDIVAQHASIYSRQAMTQRTQLVATELLTEANYDTTHVLDVTTDVSGNTGNWEQSTTARQDIKRSLQTGMETILDDTLAAVKQEDMIVVISSGMAAKLTQSQEIVDYIKASPDALAQVRGELPGSNTMYGLPDTIYGFKFVVEKTRKITTRKGATTARSAIWPDDKAVLVSRPGGLVGVADAPNFSTCTTFVQEEMTVETKRDSDNRRVIVRVVDTQVPKVVAPASGIVFKEIS
jgi:hypothetical protein